MQLLSPIPPFKTEPCASCRKTEKEWCVSSSMVPTTKEPRKLQYDENGGRRRERAAKTKRLGLRGCKLKETLRRSLLKQTRKQSLVLHRPEDASVVELDERQCSAFCCFDDSSVHLNVNSLRLGSRERASVRRGKQITTHRQHEAAPHREADCTPGLSGLCAPWHRRTRCRPC